MAARKKTAKKTTRKSTTKKTTAKRKTVARKKPAARKTTKKKVAARKTTAKKLAAVQVGKKPFTKSEFVTAVSERSGLTRKDIGGVLEAISSVISSHLGKNGPGIFVWSGLAKFKVVKKPATKQRKGVNPFTGEPCIFKAKPASRKVKVLPLKNLKEMAQ